jgi:hypothetical protein
MAPTGTYFRRNGEQVIVHTCLGCVIERHCRVAADDSFVTAMKLEIVHSHWGVEDREETIDQPA